MNQLHHIIDSFATSVTEALACALWRTQIPCQPHRRRHGQRAKNHQPGALPGHHFHRPVLRPPPGKRNGSQRGASPVKAGGPEWASQVVKGGVGYKQGPGKEEAGTDPGAKRMHHAGRDAIQRESAYQRPLQQRQQQPHQSLAVSGGRKDLIH